MGVVELRHKDEDGSDGNISGINIDILEEGYVVHIAGSEKEHSKAFLKWDAVMKYLSELMG